MHLQFNLPRPKNQAQQFRVMYRHEKLKKINESQKKKIILNVGWRKFETAVSTLMAKPHSVLAKMISPGGVKPYSVDVHVFSRQESAQVQLHLRLQKEWRRPSPGCSTPRSEELTRNLHGS